MAFPSALRLPLRPWAPAPSAPRFFARPRRSVVAPRRVAGGLVSVAGLGGYPQQHQFRAAAPVVAQPETPLSEVTLSDVSAAAFRIRGSVSATSCKSSARISEVLGSHVFLKREYEHITGSFKERGAANVLLQLSPQQRAVGVCTASAGNHALAVCYHGQRLGIPVSVVMPTTAPMTKVQNCRRLGAQIYQRGAHLLEAKEIAASKLVDEQGMTYINGFDDHGIIAGQGTVAMELLDQVSTLDAVVVPIGGGGLIAGMAVAIKALNPAIRVIGVEPRSCASWTAALAAGEPVDFDMSGRGTLADGLAVTKVGARAFHVGHRLVDDVVQVSESAIALSVLRLLELDRSVVEGGGATGIAGFLDGKLDYLAGMRVAIVLCGSNIDTPVLGRVIERGLLADGRLHSFTAYTSDRPGGVRDLTAILADVGCSVRDIHHERASCQDDVSMVAITVQIETKDALHAAEVRKALKDAGTPCQWHTSSGFIQHLKQSA